MKPMIRLEPLLDSLKGVREHTAQAVEDMPGEKFDFRPVPEVMTFREIARHVLDASQGLIGLMLAGVEDLSGPDFRPRMKEFASRLPADAAPRELAAELRESAARYTAELATRPPEFFAGIITRFDGQRCTRMELAQMVKEHEMTHRAQLFLYLRMQGITPSTTRQRQAKQAAK
jgi:uncharacterized damage-inducible protein DinB